MRGELLRVGLVSDTHGPVDPSLPRLLAGCDLILHAGDIVDPWVLKTLAEVAPVHAVRGNNDGSACFEHLPELVALRLGQLSAVLVHQAGGRGELERRARELVARSGAQLLVHGHSHRPAAALRDGVLWVNPGSAGPRRFRLPRAAGLLEIVGRRAEVRLHDLAEPGHPLLGPPLRATW